MSKPKLIVYSQELASCPCFEAIFNTEFDAEPADTLQLFLSKIKASDPDAAVICFCSAREEDAEELLKLDALTGPLPILTCSKILTIDFVTAAARQGANRFLCCEWEKARIESTILEAIRGGGIKDFLETLYPSSFVSSPHIRKMVDEIVHAFPHRMSQNQIVERLEISRSWLQKLC